MRYLKADFIFPFMNLMTIMFAMYFIATGLGKPAADLLIYMNDPTIIKSNGEWIKFIVLLVISMAIWCAAWLSFKWSEKSCLEFIQKTSSNQVTNRTMST